MAIGTLLYHYSLNETLADETGNGPILTGSKYKWVNGPRPGDKAIQFDPTFLIDDSTERTDFYAKCTFGITIPQVCTISFWAKHHNLINDLHPQMMFSLNSTSYAGPDFYLNHRSARGSTAEYFWNTGDSQANYFGVDTVDASAWRFFTIVCTTTGITVYIDGVSRGSALTYKSPAQTNRGLAIGNYITSYQYSFKGAIADFRIYDGLMYTTDVAELYYQINRFPQLRLFTNMYKHYIDFTEKKQFFAPQPSEPSAQQVSDGKLSKYALFFNGDTNRYVTAQVFGVPLYSSFTWMCWFMINKTTVQSYPIIMSFGLPYIAIENGVVRYSFREYSGGAQTNIVGTTAIQLNTWYHVAVTVDAEIERISLYVNGNFESSFSGRQKAPDGTSFEIGRHNGVDSYRMWGRIDDVRIYNDTVEMDHIKYIMHNSDSFVTSKKLSIFPNGDAQVNTIEEEIEWDLLSNFLSDLDEGISPFDTAIAGTSINSLNDISNNGWIFYGTDKENTTYTRRKGFLQLFYGGTPNGYISKKLPEDYDYVRITYGNWHTGTVNLYIGGNLVKTDVGGVGTIDWAGAYQPGDDIKLEEVNGIFWIGEVWVGKKKQGGIKTNGSINGKIIQNKYSPNLTPFTDWKLGNGSHYGLTDLYQNGDDAENVRKWAADPWGNPTIVWECIPDVDNDGDGGWNSNYIPIEKEFAYRYTVWGKKNKTSAGSYYFGVHTYNYKKDNIGVIRLSDDASVTNFYWGSGSTLGANNQWVLLVGYIYPYLYKMDLPDNTYPYTTVVHPDSGGYNRFGTKIRTFSSDCAFKYDSTQIRVRNYLYYSTDTSIRIEYAYPRLDKCDGTEPTLNELLSGVPYCNAGYTPDKARSLSIEERAKFKGNEFHLSGNIFLPERFDSTFNQLED